MQTVLFTWVVFFFSSASSCHNANLQTCHYHSPNGLSTQSTNQERSVLVLLHPEGQRQSRCWKKQVLLLGSPASLPPGTGLSCLAKQPMKSVLIFACTLHCRKRKFWDVCVSLLKLCQDCSGLPRGNGEEQSHSLERELSHALEP